MAEYDKSKHFSWGWCVGGMVLMFVISFLGGIVAAALAVTDMYALLGIQAGCYLVTGIVIGRMSEGQTILEAGIAALMSIGAVAAIRGSLILMLTPIGAVIMLIPFVIAMLGAFIGEKMQGDVITTRED